MSEIVERFERIRRDSPNRFLIHLPAAGASLTVEDNDQIGSIVQFALEERGG